MRRSVMLSIVAAALLAGAGFTFMIGGPTSAAQPTGVWINAVDLDIAPDQMAKYIEAIKENGAASVKEPGCREFNIAVLADNPNHVVLFDVYDNEAALNAHRNTDHYKKYQATTANMVTARNIRVASMVALNSKAH